MQPDFSIIHRTRHRALLAGVLALAFCGLAQAQVTVTSPETDPVKGRAPVVATAVISYTGSGAGGAVLAGDVLTANYTLSDPDGDAPDIAATDLTIQWTANGQNIGTLGSKTYTVQTTDQGKSITYKLVPHTSADTTDPYQGVETIAANVGADGQGTDPGCTGNDNCGVINPVPDTQVISVAIAPTGDPIVDTQLTATATCLATCGPGITYQWQIETAAESGAFTDISGATGATYTPKQGDQKRKLRVVATQTAP